MAEETREIGVTGLNIQGGRVYEENLRSLQGDTAIRNYKEMSETDPVVGAMLYAIEMLIRGVPLEVEPWSDETDDVKNAEFFDSLFDDMSHSYGTFVSEWMAAPIFGFAPFEIVLKKREGFKANPSESSAYDDGMIGIRKLAIRHPDTLAGWEVDEAGGIQAMKQRTAKGLVTIPIEKLLVFTLFSRKGSPEGMSLLKRAYVPWYRKKGFESLEAIGIERDLAGIPWFQVPSHWTRSDANSDDAAAYSAVKQVARRISQGDQSALVTPIIYDSQNRETFKFQLVTSAGQRQFDTGAVVERYDRRILMTALADVILLGHEKVGSFALASSKTTLFAAGLGAILDGRDDVLNRHLVPRIAAINGMPLDRLPRFKHGDIEAVDPVELTEAILNLARAGHIMFPTETGEIEREIHRVIGIPAPDDTTAPQTPPQAADTVADEPAA